MAPSTGEWTWRLSVADVTCDSAFSSLPGIDRSIAVVDGEGMSLVVGASLPVQLVIGADPVHFDGGADVACSLIDGPILDLNLMVRRDRATGQLVRRVIDPARPLRVPLDAVAIVVLDGVLSWQGEPLGHLDAFIEPVPVLLHAPDGPTEVMVAVVHAV